MSIQQRPLPPIIPLATVGSLTFALITGVFAIHNDGMLAYHSSPEEWATTPEAQVAALDSEIAEAQARLATLTASREALQPIGLLRLPAAPPAAPETATRAQMRRVRCRACGGEFCAGGFFRRHVSRAHRGQNPDDLEIDVTVPWPVPPTVSAEPDSGNS